MQNSFIIYADYEKKFALLDEPERGKLIMAIFALNRGEDLANTLNSAGQMALSFIKDQMQRDSETYEKTKISRSEAGKRGMEARWGKKLDSSDNKNNNVINVITSDNTPINNNNIDNYNVNEDVNKNEDVNVNDSKKKNKKDTAVLSADEIISFVNERIKNSIISARFMDYVKNRKAMGSKYAIKTKEALEINIKHLKEWAKTVEDAIAILNYSIANNYQGLFNIFEDKKIKSNTTDKSISEKVTNEEAEVWSES